MVPASSCKGALNRDPLKDTHWCCFGPVILMQPDFVSIKNKKNGPSFIFYNIIV